MYPVEVEIKDITESNTSVSYLDLLMSIGKDVHLPTFIYDKRDNFNFHIARLWRLNLTTWPIWQSLLFSWMFYSEGHASLQLAFRTRISQWPFEIASREFLCSMQESYQTIWCSPLTNVIWHSETSPYIITLPSNRINTKPWHDYRDWPGTRDFYRPFATDVVCQRWTLTTLDSRSHSIWNLHFLCSSVSYP